MTSLINVTAMVDMMMVLVIFLVMNFNASGEMNFVSKDLKMPAAENGLDLTRVPIIALDSQQQPLFRGRRHRGPLDASTPTRRTSRSPNSRSDWYEEREKFERHRNASRAADLPPEEDPTSTVNVQADKGTKMSILKEGAPHMRGGWYGRIRLAVGDASKAELAEGHGSGGAEE